MKVSAAIEALKALPQDRELMCQVVAQDGTVWNCFYEFHNVPHSDWLCQLRVSHTELKTLNGVGASRDSIIEECAKAAENTPTALLQNGQFFSERVAMAIRALLVGACPCTPADRVECASTPDVDKPTNCVRRRTGCPHEWAEERERALSDLYNHELAQRSATQRTFVVTPESLARCEPESFDSSLTVKEQIANRIAGLREAQHLIGEGSALADWFKIEERINALIDGSCGVPE